MDSIIRGTTPTVIYTFHTVSVTDVVEAYMTIKLRDEIVVEKTLEEATVGASTLSWFLTQEETLSLNRKDVDIMLNWKLNDGTRGASMQTSVIIYPNHKEVVI